MNSKKAKRLRKEAKLIAVKDDLLGGMQEEVTKRVYVMGEDDKPIVIDPTATNPRKKYKTEMKKYKAVSAYHQPGSKRRLYQNLKGMPKL